MTLMSHPKCHSTTKSALSSLHPLFPRAQVVEGLRSRAIAALDEAEEAAAEAVWDAANEARFDEQVISSGEGDTQSEIPERRRGDRAMLRLCMLCAARTWWHLARYVVLLQTVAPPARRRMQLCMTSTRSSSHSPRRSVSCDRRTALG